MNVFRRLGTAIRRLDTVQRIAGVALAGAVGLLVWQISEKDTPPDATTLTLFLVIVIALGALLDSGPFRGLAQRIEGFEGFGIKVALKESARRIDARFPEEDDEVRFKARPRQPGDPKAEITAVVRELRRKLRFLVISVLGERPLVTEPDPKHPDRVTEQPLVARLESVGLLQRDEAQLAHELLSDLPDELAKWDEEERASFLDNAWSFAFRLATRVFDRHARQQFEARGWFVGDFAQDKGHRPDFIVTRDGHWGLVAARVAAPTSSVDELDRLISRKWNREESRPVIVMPDYVDHLRKELDDGAVRLGAGDLIAIRLGNLVDSPALLDEEAPGPVVESVGKSKRGPESEVEGDETEPFEPEEEPESPEEWAEQEGRARTSG
jgi:hypothetical protein